MSGRAIWENILFKVMAYERHVHVCVHALQAANIPLSVSFRRFSTWKKVDSERRTSLWSDTRYNECSFSLIKGAGQGGFKPPASRTL